MVFYFCNILFYVCSVDTTTSAFNIYLRQFADNVLIEMLESNNYTNRPYFIHFFRNTVPEIKEELYNEFKDYVTDNDFDLSIRKAILNYESSEKIFNQ